MRGFFVGGSLTSNDLEFGKKAEKALCEVELYEYMKSAWHEVESPQFKGNWHVEAICEHLQAVSLGHIKNLLINVPPGTCKALDIDTPVLTTWGWKTHGDLEVGDFVYGPDGEPKRVLAITDHKVDPCSELTFDDKSSIVAADTHLWEVQRNTNNSKRKTLVVETKSIHDGSRPDSVLVADPIKMPPRRLLIDPYVLGMWLGDGTSDCGHINVCDSDKHMVEPYGELSGTSFADGGRRMQDFHRYRIPGLRTKLRVLGLIKNKHVPQDYLESSYEQRVALLQGLMDTDGECTKRGECVFSNSNRKLIDAVHDLVVSLGMRAGVSNDQYSKCNGKVYGPHWRVKFRASCGFVAFRLSRKQERVTFAGPKSKTRYIKKVTPVGDRVVNCISVEGSLYLAGRDLIKTHNSNTVSVFWSTWMWCHDPSIRQFYASYDKALSMRDSVKCRKILKSKWWQERWGDNFNFQHDNDQKTYFQNDHGGYRMSSTVGGHTMGEHPDVIVVDDPISAEGAESEKIRRRVLDWWDLGLSTRGVSRDVRKVIIMQRLHEKDLSGYIMEEEYDDWDIVILPMRYEKNRMMTTSLGFNDPRTEDGELLFPTLFNEEKCAKTEKKLREYGTAGQMQQRPVPKGGGMIKEEWIDDNMVDECPVDIIRRVRSWDLAATADDGDFTEGWKLSQDVHGVFYVEHGIGDQWSSAKRDDKILSQAESDGKGTMITIPKDPGQAGKSQAEGYVKLLNGYTVKVIPPIGKKTFRFEPFSAECERGNVKFVKGPWVKRMKRQVCLFPNSEFDDIVDSISDGFNTLNNASSAKFDMEWFGTWVQRAGNIIGIPSKIVDVQGDQQMLTRSADDMETFVVCAPLSIEKDVMNTNNRYTSVVVFSWDASLERLLMRFAWSGLTNFDETKDAVRATMSEYRTNNLVMTGGDATRRLATQIEDEFRIQIGPSNIPSGVYCDVHKTLDPLEEYGAFAKLCLEHKVLIPDEINSSRIEYVQQVCNWTGDPKEASGFVMASIVAEKNIGNLGSWGGFVKLNNGNRIATTTRQSFNSNET